MYAYCRNNPINRKDVDGDADMDIFDDDPRDDLFPKTDGGASNHYRVDLSQASNSSLYHGGIINNGYTAYGYTAFSSESSTESFSRVGRWMSKTEYSNMKNTGRVQMSSNGNTTYVANPADINAFGRQAKPGSIYVEFSVPSSSIYPAGVVGWGQIPGPGSLYDRLNQVKGLPPILGMPIAVDIQIEGEK